MQLIYTTLTEKCNKNCEYCYCPHIKEKDIVYSDQQIQELKKIFNLIEKIGSTVFLGGGEPGVVQGNELDKIFNILNSCWIATNGKFVEKYYQKYKSKINRIIYHVLDAESEIYETPVNEYVYIVHKNNIDTVSDILKKFKFINLKLYNSRDIKDDNLLLDKNDIKTILNLTTNYYNKSFIEQLKSYSMHIKNKEMLDKCRYNILPTPALNLPHNRIIPCCRSEHLVNETYPIISYDNFINHVYIKPPKDIYDLNILNEIPCEGCNRLINNENIFDNDSVKTHIRQKLKVHSIKNEI